MSSTRDQNEPLPTIVLTFHKVSPTFTWGSTNYSPRRLATLLEMLVDRGYSLDGRNPHDPELPAIRLTFDDGYAHLSRELPPLMERFGFRPTVFIPTAWLGKSNSWDYSHLFRRDPHLSGGEVRELADTGVIFGSHGHSHCDLRARTPDQIQWELTESKQTLEDTLGRPVTSLSYPFGGADGRVLAAAAACGFETGYTMRFPRLVDPPLAMGRYAIYGFDTPFSILQKVERGRLYQLERFKARVTHGLSAGTRLLNRLRSPR